MARFQPHLLKALGSHPVSLSLMHTLCRVLAGKLVIPGTLGVPLRSTVRHVSLAPGTGLSGYCQCLLWFLLVLSGSETGTE